MNYADSARIKAVLTHAGFEYVASIHDAQLVIFDTCSVRQKSEDKITWKMLEIRPDQKVWMTWCMIQHYLKNKKIKNTRSKTATTKLQLWNFIGWINTKNPDIIGRTNQFENDLKVSDNLSETIYVNNAFSPLRSTLHGQYPNIELFFRIDDTGYLPLLAQKLGYEVNADVSITQEYSAIIPHSSNQQFAENTKTAYVPISIWCSQFCSYCIVPYARGLEKNRPLDEILTEVTYQLAQGAEEIVLLGQIVNKHPDFVEICKQILKMRWVKWLRYTSPYPTFFPKQLLELHEHEEAFCPHIHMPLQSWSDAILRKMFRGYTVDEYKKFVDNIRWLTRPISITSDIIVGHPDETEEDFQESLALSDYSWFDMIYIGIYSPRPGTLGAKKYTDNIARSVKKERRTRLNDLLTTISLTNNQKELDSKRDVLISRKLKGGQYFGYTDNMKNIVINADNVAGKLPLEVGSFYKAHITNAESFKLFGNIVH